MLSWCFMQTPIYMGSKLCRKRERAVHESVMLTKIKEKRPLVWFAIAVDVLCAYQHCVCPWRKQTLSFLALGLLLVFSMCEKQCRVSGTMSCAASLPAASLKLGERSACEFSAGGPQPAPCVCARAREDDRDFSGWWLVRERAEEFQDLWVRLACTAVAPHVRLLWMLGLQLSEYCSKFFNWNDSE